MQATVLVVFGDLLVRLSVFAMVHALASLWVTKKWTMHNTRMKKQINLINTFKMTMMLPFFIFKSYLTVKRTFWVTLTLYKTNPSRTVSWRENTTKRGIIWFFVTLFVKFWNFHFLMAAILAAILNLLTRKFFRLRPKSYLICQNLVLCQIWNLYQSGIHKLKMTISYLFLLHFYVIFNPKNDFFGWPWPWIVKYSPPTDSWKNRVLHDSLWLYSQSCEMIISR